MGATIDRAAIEKLSVEERLKLMDLIRETLDEHREEVPLSDANYAELQRRLEDARANPEGGMSVEEFAARLRSRRA